MSDKELEEYINKIEPNFDSHLEKGTIEMSNEYYNLLEEKMARLINKNQELKNSINALQKELNEENLQCSKYAIENQKLKKQLEENKDRINKAIEYMEQWGKEPDADMYMQMKDYNEFKYLLKILKEDNKEKADKNNESPAELN